MRPLPNHSAFSIALVLVAVGMLLLPATGRGNILYKNYVLRTDRGQDILCAPYEVEKHDWVYKIFKLRGEISNDDFPDFLDIFRRINPHIEDINTIRPGQRILIPLRRVQRENLPVAPSGTVTIPFVQNLDRDAPSDDPGRPYTVQAGDCLSKLLTTTFGEYGSTPYREAERRFRHLNPRVQDLDRIFVGQRLILPAAPDRAPPLRPAGIAAAPPPPAATRGLSETRSPAETAAPSGLEQTARLLQATLKNRGVYFFPRPDGPDARLDLARTPLMTLPDGTRLLITGPRPPDAGTLSAIRRHWPRLTVVPPRAAARPADQIETLMTALAPRTTETPLHFNDGEIEVTVRARWVLTMTDDASGAIGHLCVTPIASAAEQTPSAVVRYLESHGIRLREIFPPDPPTDQPRPAVAASLAAELASRDVPSFVADLLLATGYDYAPGVRITFPYAGLQIEAVSNVVNTPAGTPLFIDYGELYGEALEAIRRTGFRIIRIERQMPRSAVVGLLLEALGARYETRPHFLAARRPPAYNTELVLPGVLLSPTAPEAPGGHLITAATLDERLQVFLAQRRVKVVCYKVQQTLPAPDRPPS